MRRIVLLVFVAGLLAAASPAWGGPADVANDVSSSVMSPFCPGVTLHDCPSDAASRLRARIEHWAASGQTRAEIVARLERDYGSAVEATPPSQGMGILAWLLPGVAVLAGGLVAASLARRWSTGAAQSGRSPRAVSREERARLDAELARVREQT